MKIRKKIIGVVDRHQLFSPFDEFIELKNYGNRSIPKSDVEEIIIYEKEHENYTIENKLTVKDNTKIEG